MGCLPHTHTHPKTNHLGKYEGSRKGKLRRTQGFGGAVNWGVGRNVTSHRKLFKPHMGSGERERGEGTGPAVRWGREAEIERERHGERERERDGKRWREEKRDSKKKKVRKI